MTAAIRLNQQRQGAARPIRFGWVVLAAILFSVAGFAQPAAEGGAQMREANAAFRSGNFPAAIRSYEAMRERGLGSALLEYNLGVAYYRNGEFAAARGALQRAAADPNIAPVAYYNLGLTSRAYGDFVDARAWFERVLAVSDNARLRSLASRAIQASADVAAQPVADTQARFRAHQPDREPVGELQFVIGARFGQNDNVYRSPGEAYTDIGQAGQPFISPTTQSASYMPVDVLALYLLNTQGSDTRFRFLYRLNGDFYDSEFSNANEISQRFELGADVDLEGRHDRRLRPAVYFTHHEETNFDPDTGTDREIGGEDISDRLSYGGAGLKSSYDHEIDAWSFGFDARVERRRYQDVPVLPSWDHERYSLRLWTRYRLGENTDLELGLRSMGRRFDSRLARDLDGNMSSVNETLRYTYAGVDLGVERRFGRAMLLEARVSRLERTDQFLGYADYTQNAARLRFRYRFNQRARGSVSAISRQYEYPRAFAFNDAAGGALELDSSDIVFELDYRFRRNLSMWIEFNVRDVASTDPRIAYDRTRSMLGIKWRR